MEEVLALADCLLDPQREQWERMHAVQDLDTHGPDALPYLFEAAAFDWAHDPAMLKLIGNSIANIWREAGTLAAPRSTACRRRSSMKFNSIVPICRAP